MADSHMLIELTALITANFVSNNRVSTSEVGDVVASVQHALSSLGARTQPQLDDFIPAITVRKSLGDPAKIISMIDGKPYSFLKRHLTSHGMTAEQYRARYKLPADYPMIAPAYSAKRKALALKIGLGRKSKALIASAPDTAPKVRRKLGVAKTTDD